MLHKFIHLILFCILVVLWFGVYDYSFWRICRPVWSLSFHTSLLDYECVDEASAHAEIIKKWKGEKKDLPYIVEFYPNDSQFESPCYYHIPDSFSWNNVGRIARTQFSPIPFLAFTRVYILFPDTEAVFSGLPLMKDSAAHFDWLLHYN